mgnify:CR=1 FL=1
MTSADAPHAGSTASPPREGSLRLRDGRRLAYVEAGDLQGQPVIFLHGNPGSRYMRHPDDSKAARLGVRLITCDRPGYGLSDYQRRRTLLDYPEDLRQLADALGLSRFALFGVSAGGPYVAACAYRMPDRISRAAIVSGPAPFDRPHALDGVNRDYRNAYRMASWPAWALRPMIAMYDKSVRNDPRRAFQAVFAAASRDDRAILGDAAIAAQVSGYRMEASRHGVQGLVREAQILVAPWGFPLDQIRTEMHLWYWDGDSIVPPQMGRYLQARIRGAVPHFFPDGGHFALFSHWEQILRSLIADPAAHPAAPAR